MSAYIKEGTMILSTINQFINKHYTMFCIILVIARIIDFLLNFLCRESSDLSWFIVQILGTLLGYPV